MHVLLFRLTKEDCSSGHTGEQLEKALARFMARSPACNFANSRKVIGLDPPRKPHVPAKFATPVRGAAWPAHPAVGAAARPAQPADGAAAGRTGGSSAAGRKSKGWRKTGRPPLQGAPPFVHHIF